MLLLPTPTKGVDIDPSIHYYCHRDLDIRGFPYPSSTPRYACMHVCLYSIPFDIPVFKP